MAGQLTISQFQLNDSATAANNFVIIPDNAGGFKISRGNVGATTQDILSVDLNGNITAIGTGLSGTATNLSIGGVSGGLSSTAVATTQAIGTANTSIATTQFVNPGSSIAANGYRKHPDGLIEQWGIFTNGANPTTVGFNIAFPNACFGVWLTPLTGGSDYDSLSTSVPSTSGFYMYIGAGIYQHFWRALGH